MVIYGGQGGRQIAVSSRAMQARESIALQGKSKYRVLISCILFHTMLVFMAGMMEDAEMPRRAAEMSALQVKRIGAPVTGKNAYHAVGGVPGLILQVTPTGSKTWLLRTMAGIKRREIGLGGFPEVSLERAREKARAFRESIRQGVDPVAERRAAREAVIASQLRYLTFDTATERYLVEKLKEFRNPKHRLQWKSTLETYASPLIGRMNVADLAVHDILRVLHPVWMTRTETAKRLRGRIESVLAWATVAGHRTGDNPARWKGNLDALLPKPGKVAKSGNHPAVALADAPAWFAALRKREGIAARALEFLTLCACRSGEVRGAAWSEFDLEAGLWVIPANRMKMGREHRIPLTPEAVELLRAMPKREGVDFVFAAIRGGALSDMALSAVMRRMQADAVKDGAPGWLDPRSGRPAVPHGLRSTFRDWAAERTEYPSEMAEIALAHDVGSETERAYRRTAMVERRRAMMAAWGQFLSGAESSKVVQLRTVN